MPATSELAQVMNQVGGIVESLDAQQWTAPTPCDEWDVRAVVDHLLDLQRNFRVTMTGEAKQEDALWQDNAAVLVASFEEEGALERTVVTRLGQIPGLMALNILIMEHLGHGWDLGRATGNMPPFDEAVVERTIAFSRKASADLPPHLRNFKDPQPISENAPAIDRLAALLGRTITTTV